MQYFQKHVFWDIRRQNRSSGLTPSRAEEQTNEKAQTIHILLLREGHAPEPIDMPFVVLSRIPDVNTHAKFYVKRLGVSRRQYPEKCHFLYFFERPLQQFCTTVQTVMWINQWTLTKFIQKCRC